MKRSEFLKLLGVMPLAGGLQFKSIKMFDSMQKRNIPSSGEKLPVIGVGTWQTFDVGNSQDELDPLRQVLKLLVEKGGSVVDSSPMYGRSERVVGELTRELGIKKFLFCATKVWTNGRDSGIKQMEQSMKLMNANPMDLMQIHNLVDWKIHLPVLRKWKEEGKIRYIGITHYHSGAYGQVEEVLKKEPLDFLQINYNIRDRAAEERILPLAQDKGMAVLINQPFESGSLFSSVKGKSLPVWIKEIGCESWGQFFLKFILAHSAVTCVIPGTSKPKHLLDNVQAGFAQLPDPTLKTKMINFFEGN